MKNENIENENNNGRLMPCPVCGHMISKKPRRCPACGDLSVYRANKRKKLINGYKYGFLIILVMFILFAAS